ncbi:reverse transcriptase domain-containing protein [Tanacetum coccineum]
MPRECFKIIVSKSKVRQLRNNSFVAKMSTSLPTQAVSSDVAEIKGHGSGTLPGNSVNQPKGDLKGSLPKVVLPSMDRKHLIWYTEVTKDTMPPAKTEHEDVHPHVVQFSLSLQIVQSLNQSYCKESVKWWESSNLPILIRCEITLRVAKEAITCNLDQNYKIHSDLRPYEANKKSTSSIRLVGKNGGWKYSQEVPPHTHTHYPLGFSNSDPCGNPTTYFEAYCFYLLLKYHSLSGDSDFLLMEEADSFLALEDDPTSSEVDPTYQDPEGDILLLEAILNSEPPPPLPNHEQYMPGGRKELKLCEAKTVESSVNEPPEVELKELPPHLEYAFLEGDDKLPVIIAKDLKDEEKAALLKVLKSHKRAIAWKLSDIKGVSPEFCTHKILMEEDYEPSVQSQRRVNPKIHDVIKKEVEKLLDAGLIYPISDSPWVSPVHCVPKKGGMTVITNDENELIPTRLVTGWRVCIDYRKLNEATRKDHFPLPFMDQMLERLAGNEYYCFLDGFSGYFQIPIDPKDQEKTTFTCPYGTFAYRRMPFGLCNAPGTFQRCMMAIFHDMIEKTMEKVMLRQDSSGGPYCSKSLDIDVRDKKGLKNLLQNRSVQGLEKSSPR